MRPGVQRRLFVFPVFILYLRFFRHCSVLYNRKLTCMNKALLCGLACMLLSPDIFSRCNNVSLAGPRSEYAFLNSLYFIGADTATTGVIVSNNDTLSGATWLLKHYAATNPHLVKTKGVYDIYTFENGLANTSGTVRLGGSLNQATTITGASNSLSLGTGSSALYGLTVVTENLAVIEPSSTSTEWMPLVARGANGLETRMGGSYIEARHTSDGSPSNLNFNSNVYFAGNVEFSGAVTSTWNSNLKLTTNSGGYNVWSERNFGIGISTPSAPLHVIGRPRFVTGNEAQGKVWTSDANGNGEWLTPTSGSVNWTVSGNNISNTNAGLVIIGGTVNPQPLDANIRLAVKGNICAQKLTVTNSGWADYVFAPTYKLRDLKKLKIFIQKNQHLPEMPSAAEVQNNGISLGDNQVALLKKVEELTLYLIKEHEEIERLKKTNNLLQQESNQIKKMLKARR